MNTVDEYIDAYPEETKKILQQIREIIKDSAPDRSEERRVGKECR